MWRRVDDYDPLEADARVSESLPSARQTQAFDSATTSTPAGSTQGLFRPWALLHPLKRTRAFRFSYPILCAAAWNCAFLWDVRTGALVQTIENTQLNAHGSPSDALREINYIEIGPRHVFLCGGEGFLRVFSRATGNCVLNIPASGTPFGAWNFSIAPQPPQHVVPGSALVPQEVVHVRTHPPERTTIDHFTAGTF